MKTLRQVCGLLTLALVPCAQSAPTISVQPSGGTLTSGWTTASLGVTATGTGTLTYQWKKDGVALVNTSTSVAPVSRTLSDGRVIDTIISGATGATLTITNWAPANAGNYTVTVTDTSGSTDSSAAAVTVTDVSPTLVNQSPATQAISTGGRAKLFFNVNGSRPLTVQWFKDGVALGGANGSSTTAYDIDGFTAANAGTYTVTVSNAYGSVTLQPMALTLATAKDPLDIWRWANPRPVGNNLISVTSGGGRVMLVGRAGTVISTTDGQSGDVGTSGSGFSLNTAVYDSSTAAYVAAGGFSTIMRSTDAKTWTSKGLTGVDDGFNGSATDGAGHIVLAGADFNFRPTRGLVRLSSDGGNTWSLPSQIPAAWAGLSSIQLTSATYGGGKFVVASSSGALFSSTNNGSTWTQASITGATNTLQSVNYGNGKFVAVGNGGTILTSSDGLTFTAVTSGITTNLLGVNYLPTSATWVAVGAAGTVRMSTDNGATWSAPAGALPTPNTDFYSVAENANLTVITGQYGRIFLRPVAATFDLNNWQNPGENIQTDVTGFINFADWDAITNQFVAVGASGNIHTSNPDGDSWQRRAQNATGGFLTQWVRFNNLLLASGSTGIVLSSSDGAATWTANATTATSTQFNSIAVGGGRAVVVGGGGSIFTSTNGTTWTAATSGITEPLRRITYANGQFVAVGGADNGAAIRILTSSDGLTWTNRTVGTTGQLWGIDYANGTWVAVGAANINGGGGFAVRSTDNGVTWSRVEVAGMGFLYSVRYLGGRLIATGSPSLTSLPNALAISADAGATWTLKPVCAAPNINTLRAVAKSPSGAYVAVGNDATILTSAMLSPVIVSQPTSATIALNGSLTLNVTVNSPFQLSYQWRLNGTPINGATNSQLFISNFDSTKAGTYDVVVTATRTDDGAVVETTTTTSAGAVLTLGSGAGVVLSDLSFQSPKFWRFSLPGRLTATANGKVYATFNNGSTVNSLNGELVGAIVRLNSDGSRDTTFNPGTFLSDAWAIQPLADGRVLVAGVANNETDETGFTLYRVFRLNADGSRDGSFNSPHFTGMIRYMALQSDGKLLVTPTFGSTSSNGGFTNLVRLNTDGSRDTTFNQPTFNSVNPLFAQIVVDTNGKIVIAGAFTTVNGVARNSLARLNSDGTLDTTFAPAGYSFSGQIRGLAVQTQGANAGKILVAGGTLRDTATNTIRPVLRFNSDGTLDSTFTLGAISDVVGAAGVRPRLLNLLPDDRFTVISDKLVRYTADGALDSAFTPVVLSSEVFWMDTQSDGSVIVPPEFGTTFNGQTLNAPVRFTATGALDASFAPGRFQTAVYPRDYSVQADGKILVWGGFDAVNSLSRSGFARLNVDGSLDTLTLSGVANLYTLGSASVLSDGRLLAVTQVGTYRTNTASGIARFNLDGTLDNTFAPPSGIDPSSLYVLSDNKILTWNLSVANLLGSGLSFQRLNVDGPVDATFTGLGSTVFGRVYRDASNVITEIVQGQFRIAGHHSDGRSLAIATTPNGTYAQGSGGLPVTILRLLADGTIDPAFSAPSVNWSTTSSFTTAGTLDPVRNVSGQWNLRQVNGSPFTGLVPQADGSVIVYGSFTTLGGVNAPGIARLTNTGAVDATFSVGTGPEVRNTAGRTPWVQAISVATDGKIWVSGNFDTFGGVAAPGVARLNADGSVDTTFVSGARYSPFIGNGSKIVFGPSGVVYLSGTFATTNQTPNALTRLVATGAPIISAQPLSTGVSIGGSTTLRVSVTSGLPVSYQWLRNGQTISGATNATLTLNNIQPADLGDYTVRVTTDAGTVTSNVATVNAAPYVTSQPVPRKVVQGGKLLLRFGVGANGLTYQWTKNGSAVGTNSADFVVESTQTTDAGTYVCTATNSIGNVQSASVSVTVLPADSVLWQQFTEFSTEQAPSRLFRDGQGRIYLPWSVQDRNPDMAAGLLVGTLARFDESTGALDTTFKLDRRYRRASWMDRLPDGKLLIAVQVGNAATVIRTSDTGAVDSTFNAPLFGRAIRFIKRQADGKIIVAAVDVPIPGSVSTLATASGVIYRLNADGSMDNGFTPAVLGGASIIFGVPEVDANGKIYLAGAFNTVNGTARTNVARLNADGTLDSTFAAALPTGFASTQARGVALQSDGRAVFVGDFRYTARGISTNPIMAIRFNTDGTFDNSFGQPLRLDLGFAGRARYLVVNGDDSIVFLSDRLARLNADGTRDTSFVSVPFDREGFWLVRTSDGRYLVPDLTWITVNGVQQPVWGNGVAAFSPNGQPDFSFQLGGYGRSSIPNAGRVLSTGDVWVSGGFNRFGSAYVPGLAKFSSPTALATGQAGQPANATAAWTSLPGSIVTDAAGDQTYVLRNGLLQRLNADGTVDGSYAPVVPSGYVFDTATPTAAGSGKLILSQSSIAAAYALAGSTGDAMFRLNADGSRDSSYVPNLSSFATVERATPSSAPTMIRTGGLAVVHVLSDGRALVALSAIDGTFKLQRLLANGSLDTTFNAPSFGTVTPTVGFTGSLLDPVTNTTAQWNVSTYPADDLIRAAVQMSDGKVYVGGRFSLANAPRGLVRLNADGSLDTTFTGAGLATAFADSNAYVSALTVDSVGRVYVAGRFSSFNGTAVAGLFRLAADGTLDTTWSPGFGVYDLPTANVQLTVANSRLYAIGTVGATATSFPAPYASVALSFPPAITAQPTNVTAADGGFASFFVTATGTGTLTYQWFLNGNLITGATDSSYSIPTARPSDAGSYTVAVTSASGTTISSAATLTVNASAPAFLTRGNIFGTFGYVTAAGTSATLTVTPSAGSLPITYQWRLNGNDIPGATGATYTVTNWQPANAGAYSVSATNAQGTVVSPADNFWVTTEAGLTWANPRPLGNGTTGVIFANSRFIVGGVRGSIQTSTDGVTWTAGNLTGTNNVASFAFGNGTYVGVGTLGALYYSADGTNWEPAFNRPTSAINEVVFGLGRFVTVGADGVVGTSTDGRNWTFSAVAGLTGGGIGGLVFDEDTYYAITSANKVIKSTNGLTWTEHGSIPTALNSLALSTAPEGGAVAVGPQGQIYSTNDGITWTLRTSGTTQELITVRYLNNQYVAVGLLGTLLTSPDGVTWTLRTTPTQSNLWSVDYGAGRYVVTGQAGNNGRNILTSTDGVTWTSSITGPYQATHLLGVATNNTITVAVGNGGAITTSSDLSTWTQRSSGTTGTLSDVVYAGGKFVAISSTNGAVTTSTDGLTWAVQTTTGLTSSALQGITYDTATNNYVIVGNSGGIWTSADAVAWTVRTSPTTANLRKVTAANGKLVAVSQSGEVITTTSATTAWTRPLTGAGRAFADVAFGNNTWVAVGNGVTFTSADAATWTNTTFTNANLVAVKFIQGNFIALSNNHTYFTSTDGTTWQGRSSGAFDPMLDAVAVSTASGVRFVGVGNFGTILTGGVPSMPGSRTINVVAGQRVDLNAHVSGSPVPVTYAWTKAGNTISGQTSYLHTISAAAPSDGATYVVTASNSFGFGPANITLVVNTPPAISAQPVTSNLPENGSVALSVTASGSGTLAYQWFKDGVAISGATASSYGATAAGSYTVQITSAFGTVTSAAAVVTVVPAAPVISTLPSVSGTFGPVVTTSTAAALQASVVQGTRPMTFQWSFNGVDIPGATGEFLYRSNWQTNQAGIYSVRASNSVGASNTPAGESIHVTTEGGWRWRNPTPTGNGITRAAFVNNQFLLGGLRGTILTSPDGVTWTPRPIPAQNNVFAFRYVGNRYVAMASLNAIFTSTDSITWTPRNLGIDGSLSALQDMTASPDGRLVAVGTAGVTAVSTDAGETWTVGNLGANNTDMLNGATFTLGRFFAVSTAQGRVYSSPDGTSWSYTTVNTPWLRGLAYGAGRLVAVGAAGAVFTSTDGTNWAPATSGTTNDLFGVNFLNGRFIAVGTLGTILTSPDGVTWTARSAGGNQSNLQNTAYGAGRYVIGGQGGNSGKIILTSTDSVNWTSAVPGPRQAFNFNAVAASTGTIVTVGNSGFILTSTDKVAWTDRASGVATSLALFDVAYNSTEGRFVAVGAGGVVTASSDQGVTWALQSASTAIGGVNLNGIAVSPAIEGSSGYVAVGNSGVLVTTTNFGTSTTWTRRTIGTSGQLRKVIYAGGQHVVVGGSGLILTSADTATWTIRSTGVTTQLNDVAYGANVYVAVGNAGAVFRSTDGATWSAVTRFTPAGLVSVKFIDGQFIATSTGSGAAYYVSTDGLNWSGRITGAFDALLDTESFQGEVVGVGQFGTVLTSGVPVINGVPAAITANAGSPVRISFPTWNSAEPVTYVWTKNGNVVSSAPNAPTLVFNSVVADDAGTYRLTASNSKGTTQSADVQLVLNVPLSITAQPQPQTVLATGDANFSVTASGIPAPSYTWYLNGIKVGTNSPNLTLTNLRVVNSGEVWVVVSNASGSITSQRAALTVNPLAPTITSPNAAFTVSGAPFSFQIVSASPATFGATGLPSGLTLSSSTGVIAGSTTQVGTFNVALTATNVTGTANQTLALTVQPPAPVITSALSVDGRVGQPFSYTIVASNSPTDYGAAALPAGITRNGAVLSGTPTAAGFYSAQILASNATGFASSPLSIQIAAPLNAPTFTGSGNVPGTAGAAFTFTPAFGGSPTSFALVNLPDGSPSVLPTGLTLSVSTGAIAGTTTQTGNFKVAIRATNADGAFTQVFTLTINPAPSAPAIKSATSAIGTVGTAFTFNINTDPAATSFSSTALPDGLTLNATTGVITGVPTTPGITAVTLTATNANGSGSGPLQITVNSSAAAPVMSIAAVAPGRVNVEFSFTLTASNTPTSFVVTQGTLPAGLTLNATTGAITGTPTAAGQTKVWVAASNTAGGRGPAVEMLFDIARSLNVPAITSNGSAPGQVGATFQYQIVATNSPTSYTATALPDGLTFSTSTGVISGIPTTETTTPFEVTLTAVNGDGASAPKVLAISIAPAPATPKITSTLSAGGRVGTAFSYQITATATPTSFTTDQLPDGLTLNSTTGAITGTPTASGTTNVQLRAANAAGLGQASTLVIEIAAPLTAPAITSDPTASAKVGVFFSYQIVATNTPTGYAVSGSLPGGLTLNTTTGVISGNPADSPGLFAINLLASNSAGTSQPQQLLINVDAADNTPVITSASTTTGIVGVAFSYQITATNVPSTTPFPASVSLDALGLPAGLAINASTGLIEGTPANVGTYTVALYGVNSNGTGPSRLLTIKVDPAPNAPSVTSATAVNARAGTAFSYQIAATNSPTSFEALDAPAWLSVNTTSGLLSGTPTGPGTATVRLGARNAGGSSNYVTLTITIAAAPNTPVITSEQQPPAGRLGQSFSYDLAATLSPTSYSVSGLPPGLTVNTAGQIRGTPTASGTYAVTVSATNANGEGQPVVITIVIQSSLSVSGSNGG